MQPTFPIFDASYSCILPVSLSVSLSHPFSRACALLLRFGRYAPRAPRAPRSIIRVMLSLVSPTTIPVATLSPTLGARDVHSSSCLLQCLPQGPGGSTRYQRTYVAARRVAAGVGKACE